MSLGLFNSENTYHWFFLPLLVQSGLAQTSYKFFQRYVTMQLCLSFCKSSKLVLSGSLVLLGTVTQTRENLPFSSLTYEVLS